MGVENNTGVVKDENNIYEDNNFIYNDKCSLVIIIDNEINKTRKGANVKRNNEIEDGSQKNFNIKENNCEDNNKDDNHSYDIINNNCLDEDNTKEKFQDFLKNEGKENHMIKKKFIKLHIGLDYSNFSMDTDFKIIKFINKGSHFLYWNDDDIHFFDDTNKIENKNYTDDNNIKNNLKWRDDNNVRENFQSSKEYQMNEMRKNNCEEIRNSRFLYFDREQKLLVIKYNMKNNNFVYINEQDPTYKYFLNLHNKDFLDDTLIKEKKNCILIYPYTYTKIWNTLTTYINDEVINKIEPVNKTFSSSFLKGNNNDMINLHNQPYMFYSVIPKYSSKKNKEKKYVYEKNCRNNSKEKKEDNLVIDVKINDTTDKADENIIDMSDDNINDKYYVDITDRFNNNNNYTIEHNTINNTNVGGEKTYFEYISIDKETNKYIPSDITIMNMEKYWILKEIIQQEYTYIYYNNEQIEGFVKYSDKLFYILGEFQFAFILFHLGYNYQSFIQWRKLFELMTNSSDLVTNSTHFFEEVLKAICIQLTYLSEDFFDNSDNSFILFGIYNIYEIINNIDEKIRPQNITTLIDNIDSIVYTKIGLHLPDLSFVYEEYQPTYVNEEF
ncbi:AAR2 protein, putative [Plasmodium sp. gorilla clade G2]|uniref:AAR2 protein, putative n=1 Tax=Plasmodium sp. gorilla clade G2 TaxID=880535 RepID=UPI000D21236B|nr:AAR2 protein, putative [Plasmodium sp. gorilla clade G2]SOV17361.1 AAR2 protein, putative [Plasmodium sp. gorilla clade G2]